MTVREALVSRTRAPLGAVRWTRAAVIALFAALAVLVHHETAAAALASASSSSVHVMPGRHGTMMAGGASGQSQSMGMSAHAHGGPSARTAELPATATPAVVSDDGPACSGMVMQHCASASVDAVKLVPPAASWVPRSLNPHDAATTGPKVDGTVGRAPPDLSVLSQLRI